MGWCERCGAFFVINSGRRVGRTIGARGRGTTDVIDSVCPSCLLPDEKYDEYGTVWKKKQLDAIRANANHHEQ